MTLTDTGVPEVASQRLTELLAALSVVLDAAEQRADGHAVRAAYVSARIASALSLPDDRCEALLYAGLLSDVGTVGPGPDPEPDTARARRGSLSRYRRDATPAHLSRPYRARAVINTLGLPVRSPMRWPPPKSDGTAGDPRTPGATGSRATAGSWPSPRRWPASGLRPCPRTSTGCCASSGATASTPGLVDEVLRMGRAGLWAELSAPALTRPAAGAGAARQHPLDA